MNCKTKYQQGFIDCQVFLKNKILSMNLLFRFRSVNFENIPEEAKALQVFKGRNLGT